MYCRIFLRKFEAPDNFVPKTATNAVFRRELSVVKWISSDFPGHFLSIIRRISGVVVFFTSRNRNLTYNSNLLMPHIPLFSLSEEEENKPAVLPPTIRVISS